MTNVSRVALALLAVTVSTPLYSQSQRSDAQIIADVRNILTNEAVLQGQGNNISAAIRQGVVTLSGTVTSNAGRVLASRDIADVPGIKTVLNDITVGGLTVPAAPAVATASATPDRTKLLELPAHTPSSQSGCRRKSTPRPPKRETPSTAQ